MLLVGKKESQQLIAVILEQKGIIPASVLTYLSQKTCFYFDMSNNTKTVEKCKRENNFTESN